MNTKIPTDQELIIFWENVCQKLRKLMNKVLIIFRRAIDNSTQHGTCELHHKQLQFRRGVCICGKKPAFKTVIEYSSKAPPSPRNLRGAEERTAGWEELREGAVFTWFQPGFSQKEKIQRIEVKKSFRMKVLFTTDLVLIRAMRTKHQSACWEAQLTGRRFSGAQPHLRILTGR